MAEIDPKVVAGLEQSRDELVRFFEGVLRDHEDDPEVIAHEPIEEVEEYLRQHGLEGEAFLSDIREMVRRSALDPEP